MLQSLNWKCVLIQVAKFSLPGSQMREFEITPMADAAARGLLEVMQVLMDYGADINAINEVGQSQQ